MSDGSTGATGVAILHSKLRPPVPRAQVIDRPRLTVAFDPAFAAPLTLVDAPAGWGKSTLLGAWVARAEPGVASFVQLDRSDNEPAVFYSYVLAALRAATRGALDDLDVRLDLPRDAERLALQLADALWSVPQPVVLALDDLHLIGAGGVLDGLSVLIERAPPNFHLVIGTRSDPALPVARLRASGRLTEVRTADLAFTRDETATLLNDIMELELSDNDVDLLRERTEGWPAGTYLAGLSMRERADRSAFIAAFAGDARHIVDYLAGEVLGVLDDDACRFLIETSVLDTLTPDACDGVLGRTDSAQRLRAMEQANLFLIPLDDRRHEYRYHHLFRQWLAHELRHTASARATELERRASDWYDAQHDPERAVAHALRSGDMDRAAALVARHWYAAFQAGRNLLIAEWLEALPDERTMADPWLALADATARLNSGAPHTDVDWWLSRAEDLMSAVPDDERRSFELLFALEAGAQRRMVGRHSDALAVLAPAADRADADPPAVGALKQMAGSALFWLGRHEEAEVWSREGVALCEQHDVRLSAELGRGILAANALLLGDLQLATARARSAVATARDTATYETPYAAMTRIVEVLTRPHPQPADLDAPIQLSRQARYEPAVAFGLAEQAPLLRRDGDLAAARACLREAAAVVDGFADPGFLAARIAAADRLVAVPHTATPRHVRTDEITERERQLLRLLSGTMSQPEIAAHLVLSINTVKSHVKSIYTKLGAASRAEAVAVARRHDLL